MASISFPKITPPQLTNTLPRPRLLNLLKKNADKKLILILGQAAQGKSTLAASFLGQNKTPAAWVNLGPEESDPVNLFQVIVQTLQQVLPGSEWTSLLGFPSRTMGPRDPVGFYREWIRGLGREISRPVFLVLDGLDRLGSDSRAFSFLQVLMEVSPPDLHLLLCSRQLPPADLQVIPLKMKQQALVLTNEDIAFTREETRDFFVRTRNITFKGEPLRQIQQATEGWIGGLVLLAESMGRKSPLDRDRVLSGDFLSHFRLEAFEYLGEEIFEAQPPEVKGMLIKASLAPFLDPALIRALSGVGDGERVLQDFVGRNLFVQGLYEAGQGWSFRFHQLFREFLLNKFQETFSSGERAALYQKAATLFQERGDLEEAAHLFILGKDSAAAADVIRQIGLELFEKGRTEDLSKLLGSLPKDLIQLDPWLLLAFSLTRRWTEMDQNVERFSDSLSLFEKAGDLKGVLLSLAYLLEASLICRTPWNSLVQLFDKAQAWLAQSGPGSYLKEKVQVWLSMGLIQIMYGDARQGYQACRNAYLLARSLKNTVLECHALCDCLKGLSILGEYRLAETVARQLEQLAESVKDVESKTRFYAASGLFNTFSGNSRKAYDDLQAARRLITENGLFYNYLPLLYYEIAWHGFFGSLEEAESKVQEVMAIAESLKNDLIKGYPNIVLGFSYYKSGRLDKAGEIIPKALQYSASDQGYSQTRQYGARVVQGMINHRLNHKKEIIGDLEEILDQAQAINHCILMVDTHLALGIIKGDYGNRVEAEEHIKGGLTLAQEKKYYYSFLLSPEDFVKGCLMALEFNIGEVYPLVRLLLTERYPEVAETELLKLEKNSSPELRSRVGELLQIIHHGRVPLLEIKTLGGLQIIRGGRDQITEESWAGQQPKRVLMSLLCHPGGKAQKEVIIEELWSLENAAKGESNFKVTLLRLRKSLEAAIHPTFGSSYIHLHHNRVELSPEFTRIDTDDFLMFAKAGKRKEMQGDTRGAMEEYGRMLDIYRGDFLPEENSLPGVDRRRNELKKTFIESLERLAKLSEETGSIKKAAGYYQRILEADPLREGACRKLMRLSLNLQNYNEALRAFDSLKKNLEEELKSQPDPKTLSLHKQIREIINQG